ncbi:MAG TPA: hypothetical protein VFW47_08220 [Phenylobacterium sp.]|nr:hypothetical protein [Phenylobacterium sp.]
MQFYTFYPQTADGAPLMFEALELEDDLAATAYCARLLAEHRSAVEVVVWEGDRRLSGMTRRPPREPEPWPGGGAGA